MARYGKKSQEKVKKVRREKKKGTWRSGKSGKKVTSGKQAIAIGLSEARRAGAKVPSKKSSSKKEAVPRFELRSERVSGRRKVTTSRLVGPDIRIAPSALLAARRPGQGFFRCASARLAGRAGLLAERLRFTVP